MSFLLSLCMCDTVATCGQYLALVRLDNLVYILGWLAE